MVQMQCMIINVAKWKALFKPLESAVNIQANLYKHSARPITGGFPSLVLAAKHRARRMGLSLLEITFVLLIIVAVVGGALIMASGAMSQSTVTQEIQTLNNLASGATMTKSTRGYGGGDGFVSILEDMNTIGTLPKNITVTGGGLPLNSWGGQIDIQVSNLGADFVITYQNVPKEECVKLVNGVKMGILRSVGPDDAVTTSILDVTPSQAATICDAAGGSFSGPPVTVSWSTQNL